MLTTDMKLPKKYVETIADHWVRKNIQTAKEAMELARKEHDKYTTWKNKPQSSAKKTSYTKNRREEKVPDWFYKRNEKSEEVLKDTTNTGTTDFEKERQKILEKLGNIQNKVGE